MGSYADIPNTEYGKGTVSSDADGRIWKTLSASGGAFANGDVVIYSAGDSWGYTVEACGTGGNVQAVAGVAMETISSGSYGRIQIGGVHTAVKLDGGTTDVAAKDPIATGKVTKYGMKFEGSTAGCILGIALEAATGLTSTGAVLIRLA